MRQGAAQAHLDPRWAQVQRRQHTATFVYAVRSTGVYCLASCPSRRPLSKNVVFFATARAAEGAGFRPCKRCRPNAPASAGPILAMCALLQRSDTAPRLRQLAAHVGLSESHAHRSFVKATGLTPQAYHQALLRGRVQSELQNGSSVTAAIYAAGYGAASPFYRRAPALLGMSPKQARTGGKSLSIRFAVGECSLGSILVAATERGVCAVLLGDAPEALIADLEARFPQAQLRGAEPDFERVVASVVGLVEGTSAKRVASLPLDVQGTVFQERVWRALQEVPPGSTTTYAELAAALGMPRASRAVAGACAANPAAVVIPCHRVVRRDGSLAGYRWGIERKRQLLASESARTRR